jgi:hypothetical protein
MLFLTAKHACFSVSDALIDLLNSLISAFKVLRMLRFNCSAGIN